MNSDTKDPVHAPVKIMLADHLANRLLLKVTANNALIEATPLDVTGDGKFVRLRLDGNCIEWRHADSLEIMHVIEDGVLAKIVTSREETAKALLISKADYANLRTENESLKQALTTEREAKEGHLRYIEKANAKRNEAVAGLEAERTEHENTRRELGRITAENAALAEAAAKTKTTK